MKRLAAILLSLAFLAPGIAFAGDTSYFLFRHAEKVDSSRDPELSEEGKARAMGLARLLGDGVTHIFSTDFIRTRDTVAPLAEVTGVQVTFYDPFDLEGFAEELKGMEGTIVVVGHSNTTPELAAFLSGQTTDPMPETEYDRIYHITKKADGTFELDVTK